MATKDSGDDVLLWPPVGDRRHYPEALAEAGVVVPTKRNGAEETRVMRLMYAAWDVAIVFAICTALFWITREVLVILGAWSW